MPSFVISRRKILFSAAATVIPSWVVQAQSQPADQSPPYNGEAMLVVYPDYPVNTDTWYGNTDEVGHAGVLLVSPAGLTRYFEFGRYDPQKRGMVRSVEVPRVMIINNGKAALDSLKPVMRTLSEKSGKGGKIRAAYFINMDFAKMEAAARAQQPTYNIAKFNCGHYAEKIAVAGNPRVDRPLILNPTPNNIVDEYIEEGNAEVTFFPPADQLTVGPSNESYAKTNA